MNTTMKVSYTLMLVAIAIGIIAFMKKEDTSFIKEGHIGRSEISIADGKMTPEVILALGRLSDPQVSPDGKKIIYGVSYTSVPENRTNRNLYICNLDGSDNQLLTKSGKSIGNARWSADGKHIAFTKGGQIWVADLKMKNGQWTLVKARQISDIPNGVGEFKLSPDQKKIMYISSVKSNVDAPSDRYEDLDKATAYTTDDLMYRHWDHTVMEIPHTFIADFSFGMKAKEITPEVSTDILAGESGLYELPTEPFGGIEQLAWNPDGKYIAYSCRKVEGKRYAFSTDTEIYIYSIESGETMQIEMGGGYDTDPVWSPDGAKLCWVSMERDGYEADKQRLMLADIEWANGTMPRVSNIRDITAEFKYDVNSPVWSADSRNIYFSSIAEGLKGIFVAELKAEGWAVDRITDADRWNDFGSPFHVTDKDGVLTLYTTWCSMDFPTELVAVRHTDAGNEYIPVTDENGHILSQLDKGETEARMIRTVDGKDMLTWVLYPPHFDNSKEYPGITICLGGPQGTLSQGWSYRWNYRLMAAQGYVVVLPNRRGTTAFGQDWKEQISGDYSGLNMQDYLVAASTVKAEKYVGKMAACGASYGGYSVYNLCGTHGDVFDAFVAHAGIFNQEHMYMTTEEMWFPNFDNGGLHEAEIDPLTGTAEGPIGPAGDGLTFGGIKQGGSPWSTEPKTVRHYKNSPHKFVTKWHTPLLVIHGAMDYRVPLEQGMAAYNCAQMMGVPSRLLIFPDENHWILKPQNSLMWHREYFRWLDQWCR